MEIILEYILDIVFTPLLLIVAINSTYIVFSGILEFIETIKNFRNRGDRHD